MGDEVVRRRCRAEAPLRAPSEDGPGQRRQRSEVVNETHQGPPDGGHQIGVMGEVRELAGQRRPPTDWNLTSGPGAPVDAAVAGSRDSRSAG